MSRLVLLAFAASLAACAAPASRLSPAPDSPASAATPPASATVRLASLEPVAQPDLPAVLRTSPMAEMDRADHGAMDHGAMDHGAMDHGAMDHGETPSLTTRRSGMDHTDAMAAAPLADALDAYLAVHDALAQDRTDPAAADRLADLVHQSTEAGPAGDPHLWHRLDDDVRAARAAVAALRQAETLAQARAAFGDLGVPFSALVAASDSGDGLERHTCGMTDAPQGGVWLQRAGPARNPFFGTAMLMCRLSTMPVSDR